MELDVPASIPDVCDDDGTACDEIAGAIVDDPGCWAEDEERRWLLRVELDACSPCVLSELDDTAAPLDSAAFDVAELEAGSSAVLSEDDS